MHRLQISLPEWQYRFLRERVSRTGQSIAGLIRNLIEQKAQAAQRPVEEDPIWKVVGIGQGGPPYDVSERVDEFLYECRGRTNVSENHLGG